MQITLPTEVERMLVERARQAGITPEHLALEVLRRQLIEPSEPEADASLADFLAGYIGVLGDESKGVRPDSFSEQCGKRFGAGLLDTYRRRHPS